MDKKSYLVFLNFSVYLFLICSFIEAQNLAKEKVFVEVGIASIKENDNNVIIDIYAINEVPIAGVQFEIEPNDLFIIDSISGGRCAELGFQLHSNNKGVLLGFSMKGTEIPKSVNKNIGSNILFSAYGKKNKDLNDNQKINLKTTLAAKAGKKINTRFIEYIYKK